MAQTITFSPAYTLVPTYECFNHCDYCNFRRDPGTDQWLDLTTARQKLAPLKGQGVSEILILSGEVHPDRPEREAWITRIEQLCKLAIELGFFPHTNAGILSFAEMKRLHRVNVSLGLMLEQITPLPIHRHAPSKDPSLRLEQLAWAGELKIPFTTGLLLGIGETEQDWEKSLEAIAALHRQWGHIQEVILQPYNPGTTETYHGSGLTSAQMTTAVRLARAILPAEITIQIPPNLIQNPATLLTCLDLGARDLGGIMPRDEVNPNYPHPTLRTLANHLNRAGWQLAPRLPVYPHHDCWIPAQIQSQVRAWRSVNGDTLSPILGYPQHFREITPQAG